MAVSKAQVKTIALSFPGALEKPSYGRPAFFIEKKFFTRLREEDNAIVMIVDGIEQRDMLLELDPDTYFITDHYKNYPSILVRIAKISPSELKTMLERRWRQIAPKKLQQQIQSPVPPGKAARGKTASGKVSSGKAPSGKPVGAAAKARKRRA